MMKDSLSEKMYIFIFFAFFLLVLRILTVYLGEETSRKFGYRDETLWEGHEKGNWQYRGVFS
jgi:hypothetical protein